MALNPDHSRELANWANNHRMSGLLLAAAEHGAIGLTAEATEQSQAAHEAQVRTSLALEASAVHFTQALAAAGVEAIWIKGLAAAHLDYPDPAWRNSVDIDLLVPRDAVATALQVLMAEGARRAGPALGPDWERRFARTIQLRAENGAEVDVHLALAVGYFGVRLDHPRLTSDVDHCEVAGSPITALSAVGRFISTAYAVVLSRGPDQRLLRDLAQLALVTEADVSAAMDVAGEGSVVIERALQRASAAIPPLGVHPLAQRLPHEPTRSAARALRLAEHAHAAGWGADARSTLRGLPLKDRPRFIAGIVLPPRESLRQRGRSRIEHARRLLLAGRRPIAGGDELGEPAAD